MKQVLENYRSVIWIAVRIAIRNGVYDGVSNAVSVGVRNAISDDVRIGVRYGVWDVIKEFRRKLMKCTNIIYNYDV